MVRQLRSPADIQADVHRLPHPASELLSSIRDDGVPVNLKSDPWSKERLDAAMDRGPHQSVLQHEDFLEEDLLDMVKKGQWIVLPFDSVRHIENLRVSPPGVVPQRDRRPRMISDFTFSGINDETLKLLPPEAMQFGRALQRVVQNIVFADPRWGPVFLGKIDVADGFYRIILKIGDIPKLGLVLPPDKNGVKRVLFPTVLPMGWVESPPGFCAFTETACDLANLDLKAGKRQPPHKLEEVAATPPPDNLQPAPPPKPEDVGLPPTFRRPKTCVPQPPISILPTNHAKPLSYWDVYMDDYLGQVQGGTVRQRQALRALLHNFDKVLRPLGPDDPPTRKEPVSVKKCLKGDACWRQRKVMLGWVLDTQKETMELPNHRLVRLYEILESLPATRSRIALKKWHKILGELRSMAIAIPGLRGLFSLLQEAFRNVDKKRVKLSPALHGFLDDIRVLALDLGTRPTRMREVVPTSLAVVSATDAAKPGMGGVFFAHVLSADGQSVLQPYLWRAPFPKDIQDDLVSTRNPRGTITNSDLELAGTIAHQDVMAQVLDIRERTTNTSSDNTPAVAWQKKGSTTTTGPAAYLLRVQAFHQRFHRYHPRFSYIPGPANRLADDCSRRWDLSDQELLTYFNCQFPQAQPWQLCHLMPKMLSTVICALRRQRSAVELCLAVPMRPMRLGSFGETFVPPSTRMHSSPRCMTRSLSYKSTPVESETEEPREAVTAFALAQWLKSSVQWVRRSPFWGPLTPGSTAMVE